MDLSQFEGWLAQLNVDWLKGLVEGAVGMWILNRAWDYFLTRRKEKREQRLDQLGVIEEWLDAVSSNLTTMGYSVEALIESQRRIAEGRQAKISEDTDYLSPLKEDIARDAKKLDDMMPRVEVATQNYPTLRRQVVKIAESTQRTSRILWEPMEKFVAEIEELESLDKLTKQQFEEIASKHRRNITEGIKAGRRGIEQVRRKVASAHAEIARLK